MLARFEHEPLRLFNRWHRDFDRALNNGANGHTVSAWSPAVDIKEDDDAYVLHADVPGVAGDDIEIHLEDGVLIIKGERAAEEAEEKENYRRVERVSGGFARRFSLPDTADAENISAKSENGVLEVRIPKLQKAQPRRIAVQH